jgi:hypothetical protein
VRLGPVTEGGLNVGVPLSNACANTGASQADTAAANKNRRRLKHLRFISTLAQLVDAGAEFYAKSNGENRPIFGPCVRVKGEPAKPAGRCSVRKTEPER